MNLLPHRIIFDIDFCFIFQQIILYCGFFFFILPRECRIYNAADILFSRLYAESFVELLNHDIVALYKCLLNFILKKIIFKYTLISY